MRYKTVSQWLAWQETLNPREIELGLERVGQVYNRLELDSFKPIVITVAGTNGKGSCVALLSSILVAAGYKVGAYISPHILRYNERIRLNENDIDDISLCNAFQTVDDARTGTPLTYFEFGTLAALQIFAEANVDVMILEVGLGGRLDAVNIIDADVALISSIGIDHTDWLGSDRESIAREKAGILRANRPLVCGEADPPEVVVQMASALASPMDLVHREFTYQHQNGVWSWQGRELGYESLPLPALSGEQQLHNSACVLAVLERLKDNLLVTEAHIQAGLKMERLAGRIQIVGRTPLQVVDVAHNPQAAAVLASELPALIRREQGTVVNVHAVFGMLADKDIPGVITALAPVIQHWYVAGLPHPRSASAAQLRSHIQSSGITAVQEYGNIFQALAAARAVATEQDCILVCGSFYTVADVLLPQGA